MRSPAGICESRSSDGAEKLKIAAGRRRGNGRSPLLPGAQVRAVVRDKQRADVKTNDFAKSGRLWRSVSSSVMTALPRQESSVGNQRTRLQLPAKMGPDARRRECGSGE